MVTTQLTELTVSSYATSSILLSFASYQLTNYLNHFTKVSFISTAAHQKFMLQCHRLINTHAADQESNLKTERLKSDLSELQRLLENYLQAVSQIPGLANEYNMLQRRIRISARKIQPAKSDSAKRK